MTARMRRVWRVSSELRSAFGVAGICALLLAFEWDEVAEPEALAAPSGTLTVVRSPAVKAELKKLVAKRPLYDDKRMKANLVAKGNNVVLKTRLSNGKLADQILLSAAAEKVVASVATAAGKLPQQLAPRKAQIEQEWVNAKVSATTFSPNSVDHRSTQTPIRSQGQRGTCTAFAVLAGLESYYRKKYAFVLDLSENDAYHLFVQQEGSSCPDDPGAATTKAAKSLTEHRICAESAFPYSPTVPGSDTSHRPDACTGDTPFGIVTYQPMLSTELGGGAFVNATNTRYLEVILAAGYDIVYNVGVAGTDWVDNTMPIDVQQSSDGNPAPIIGHHVMLMVGYQRDPADQAKSFFVFKNSWGTSKGSAGYFLVSYTYIQVYGHAGFYILDATKPPAPTTTPATDGGLPAGAKPGGFSLDGGIKPPEGGIKAADGG